MVKMDIVLPQEGAHETVFRLGLLGCCQFVDCQRSTVSFQRRFTGDIRRCDDVERKLRYIGDQIAKAKIVVPLASEATTIQAMKSTITMTSFYRADRNGEFGVDNASVPHTSITLLDQLESVLAARELEVRQLNAALREMKSTIRSNRESHLVHQIANEPETATSANFFATERHEQSNVLSDRTIAGIVSNDKLATLSRLVYRVSRGNSVLRIHAIDKRMLSWRAMVAGSPLSVNDDDDSEDDEVDGVDNASFGTMPSGGRADVGPSGGTPCSSSAFVIFCHASRMLERIRKVCLSLGARIYDHNATRSNSSEEVSTLISTYRQTLQRKRELLTNVAGSYDSHAQFLKVEKSVLGTLNLLHFSGVTCRGAMWIPKRRETDVRSALIEGSKHSGMDAVPTILAESSSQRNPPTYFETNKYTAIFQGIVDSYGVARYKEVNPGVFTIITFPYLFGIMFGDMGHGILLTLIATVLVAFESRWEGKKVNEIFAMIFSGRYLLLLMGIFAVYIGMLYNDFFGFSIALFQSGYQWPELPSNGGPGGIVHPTIPDGKPNVRPEAPYAFGIDVAWTETENKLEYYNSVKMKCAVIIGVIQMLAGIVLSLLNHVHRKEWYKVWFLFVPEIVFLSFTFGYMSLLIVIKWCTRWENTNDAPSLLETMTNFFLSPGTVSKPLFAGQGGLQGFLMVTAFSMAPLMLLVAPYYEKKLQRERLVHKPAQSCATPASPREGEAEFYFVEDEEGDVEAPHDTVEITIHYIIHTIEFVLGAVSNTASYLRLWALSLAHAQLSEVFFTFGIVQTLDSDSTGVMIFVGSGVWLGATIGVLLGMEALSAFLHSLRLHWVEFQNKFYSGDGVAFTPLDLLSSAGTE